MAGPANLVLSCVVFGFTFITPLQPFYLQTFSFDGVLVLRVSCVIPLLSLRFTPFTLPFRSLWSCFHPRSRFTHNSQASEVVLVVGLPPFLHGFRTHFGLLYPASSSCFILLLFGWVYFLLTSTAFGTRAYFQSFLLCVCSFLTLSTFSKIPLVPNFLRPLCLLFLKFPSSQISFAHFTKINFVAFGFGFFYRLGSLHFISSLFPTLLSSAYQTHCISLSFVDRPASYSLRFMVLVFEARLFRIHTLLFTPFHFISFHLPFSSL